MSRYTTETMTEAVLAMGGVVDDSGQADFVLDRGHLVIAPEPDDMKAAFKRIKKVNGYRWVMINAGDLFAANTLSLGSKAGMITPDGKVLKNADIPRKKI